MGPELRSKFIVGFNFERKHVHLPGITAHTSLV